MSSGQQTTTCLKCLKEKNAQLCHHYMSQRVWQETYTFVEVAFAVTRLCYKLLAIEEGLIYPQMEYTFSDFMKILVSKKNKIWSGSPILQKQP